MWLWLWILCFHEFSLTQDGPWPVEHDLGYWQWLTPQVVNFVLSGVLADPGWQHSAPWPVHHSNRNHQRLPTQTVPVSLRQLPSGTQLSFGLHPQSGLMLGSIFPPTTAIVGYAIGLTTQFLQPLPLLVMFLSHYILLWTAAIAGYASVS